VGDGEVTTVAPGPYVHAGPYVDAEFFDTTGTPHGFCPECEHAPCIAGGKNFCTHRPRFIVAAAIRKELFALLDEQFHNPLELPLRAAVWGLVDTAHQGGTGWGDDWLADHVSREAFATLAEVRRVLRELTS
jgi:hypothetical protein